MLTRTTLIQPIPIEKLRNIAKLACDSTFSGVDFYEHSQTAQWNTQIINSVLRSLIQESSPAPNTPPSYKFAVTSTIIQHLLPTAALRKKLPASATEGGANGTATTNGDGAAEAEESEAAAAAKGGFSGRRGMHSATGAFWNNDKDGLWNYKYESGEGKGLDVVVTIIWISM
jgi:hypothetical protein